MKKLYVLCMMLAFEFSHAQIWNNPNGEKKQIPYRYLRESNVMWLKRVWRKMDLKEKQNLPLYYPVYPTENRTSLFMLIHKAASDGNIRAFGDDQLKQELSQEVIKGKGRFMNLTRVDSITPSGEVVSDEKYIVDSTSIFEKIQSFLVMEEWFFNKETSETEVRILAICPQRYDETKDIEIPLYWIYFPELRPYLAKTAAFNMKNDMSLYSLDDVFIRRMFSSIITRESNVYDRAIAEYAKGLDALEESNRIKNDIFLREMDLWHF